MPSINSNAHDALLNYIRTNTTTLYICSAEPTTLTEATTTYALGNKSTPTIGTVEAGDVSGRKITIAAITDGTVTATGTATHFALVSGTELLVAQTLTSSQSVTSGNTFASAAADIESRDPT